MVARVTRVCAADATGIYWLGKRTSRRPTPRRPGHEPLQARGRTRPPRATPSGAPSTSRVLAVGRAAVLGKRERRNPWRGRSRPGTATSWDRSASQSVARPEEWPRWVIRPTLRRR